MLSRHPTLALLAVVVVVAVGCSDRAATHQPPPDGGVVLSGPKFAAGASHVCSVLRGGAVRCWGDNSFGQLGRSPGVDPLADYSVDLGAGKTAAAVYAGLNHTCVILTDGGVKCWGDNAFGQLGLGDMLPRGTGDAAMGDSLPLVELGTGHHAVAVAAGASATCALLEDSSVKCWGDAYQGATGHGDIQTRGATPGTMGDNLSAVDLGSRDGVAFRVKQVAAIDYHSFCAILDDTGPDNSGLKCWGSNDYCELGLGTREGGRGATTATLGNDLEWVDLGATATGARRKAVGFSAGYQFACALGDDGVVKCWGVNLSGQLGLGNTDSPWSCEPNQVGDAGLVSLPAPAVLIGARGQSDGGGAHACAVLSTGEVTCWGENANGQLGTGDADPRLVPSAPFGVGDAFAVESFSLGNTFTCASDAGDRVKCWGSNQDGWLDPEQAGDILAPGGFLRFRGRPVVALAAGAEHTCAVLDGGALKCWGRNSDGQLGLGDQQNRGDQPGSIGDALPPVSLGDRRVVAVAAGEAHTCAVVEGGAVACWGRGAEGQLGDGTAQSRAAPGGEVALPEAAAGVAAGVDFSCALLASGHVTCWGGGARGQLGDGTTDSRPAPAGTVALGDGIAALAAGAHHACALAGKGDKTQLWCWGANDRGQLGAGDLMDRSRPVRVDLGGSRVVAMALGGESTCALLDGGGVACWGANQVGQLGLGDAVDRAAPRGDVVDLGAAHTAVAISVGGDFSCALVDATQVKCWGNNRLEQLGALLTGPAYGDDANELGNFLPTAFQGGGRSVRTVVAGRAHACAILDTGDVRCWGDNAFGQLGVGDARAHSLFSIPAGIVELGRQP